MENDFHASKTVVALFLLFAVAAGLRCNGTYLENCQVDIFCSHNGQFSFEDIFVEGEGRNIHCDSSYSYINNLYHRLFYFLKYGNYESRYYNQEKIPDIDGFPRERMVEFDLSSLGIEETPLFYSMENLKTLNLSGNFITQAKMYNEEPLPSLETIDYSHNVINSFDNQLGFHTFTRLNNLNVSHNSLIDIPNGLFENLRNLFNLDLSHNSIQFLDVNSFDGLSQLRKLDLTSNLIGDCNWSLQRLGLLEELYLDNNQIKKIKSKDFEKLVNLKVLSLNSNFIVTIENNFFKTMNYMETLQLKNISLKISDKTIFEGMPYLQTIDLSYNDIRVFYRNMFKGKNISSFSIEGNNITGSLGKGVFEGVTLVKKIDLSKQSISEIEDHAFYMMENLSILNISSNVIENLSELCFKTLRNLKELDLSYNRIDNINFDKLDLISLHSLNLKNNFIKQLSSKDFIGLAVLQYLTLSNNNISNVEKRTFKPLHELITLDLLNNPLSGVIESEKFDGLNLLMYLELSQTSLNMVKNGSFHNVESLKHLNMSRSNLTEFDYDVFFESAVIEIIDLSYNKLKVFHINNAHLRNLNELYLNNNFLFKIAESEFRGLDNLSKLSLSQNMITYIEPKAFQSLNELLILDLSFNSKFGFDGSLVQNNSKLEILKLSGIENKTEFTHMAHTSLRELQLAQCNIDDTKNEKLYYLTELRFLDLSQNNIAAITVEVFDNITNLRFLDLSYNKIVSIQPGSFKNNMYLSILNISHNSISSISYGTFRGIHFGLTIDLSFNSLNELNGRQFSEVPNLEKLIVDYNNIKTIEIFMFHGLRLLSLGNNLLQCEDVHTLIDNGPISVTALRIDYHTENAHGIPCTRRGNVDQTVNIETIDSIENNGHSNSSSLLNDIRKILLNIRDKVSTAEKIHIDSNAELESTIIKNVSVSVQEKLKELHKINDVATYSNYTNELLRRIIDILTVTSEIALKSGFNYSYDIKGNASNDLAIYDTLKREFELKNIIEHNKLADVEDKIALIISRLDKIQAAKTTMDSITEKFVGNNVPITESRNNIFTEVCVSFILIILVGIILYKLYYYVGGVFSRSRRTASTRQIAESIDM